MITAVVGLLTARFNHRWQQERLILENEFALLREVQSVRRETYARYVVSAQNLFDGAWRLYVLNRENPVDPSHVQIDPPDGLDDTIVRNESLRIEVMLLAGPAVQSALAEYDSWLKEFWPRAASGTDLAFSRQGNTQYHALLSAMQTEVTSGIGSEPHRN